MVVVSVGCGGNSDLDPGADAQLDAAMDGSEACPEGTYDDGSECIALTACLNDEYQSTPPSATSDRACSLLTVCSLDEYETLAPSAASDRACSLLTVCSLDQYETLAPSATSDRACSLLTVCSLDQYETLAPSATSDRACGPLPYLTGLVLSSGSVSPAITAGTYDHTSAAGVFTDAIALTPTVDDLSATITVDGTAVASGDASALISLALGPNLIVIEVTSGDGLVTLTYQLVVDRASALIQQTYGKAGNTDSSDLFGYALAMSGDTLAIGAYQEDSSATGVDGDPTSNAAQQSGAVYVFRRTGTVWTQEAYLKASNTEEFDFFGSSIALSGDTLAVGAYQEDGNTTGVDGNQADNFAPSSGAVYVFTRTGTTWSQQAYLKASNTAANDQFGYSVAVSGDTLAVGAYQEDSSATGINGNQTDDGAVESGAVYVFTRTGITWSQQAYLKASNTNNNDFFGYQLSLFDHTLAVGAPGEDSNATGVGGNQADNSASDSGAAYVFTRTGTVWSQQAYLKASNTNAADGFATNLSLAGDTLVVASPGEDSSATGIDGNQGDNSASDSGGAYVFTRTGTVWSQQAYLKASNTDAADGFGSSVSLAGDLLAVGAKHEDSNATGIDGNQGDNSASDSGAVLVFRRDGGTWSQHAYVKASNSAAIDEFGASVAVSGDTVAACAPREDSSATGFDGDATSNAAPESGAVYVFR
jgi:hypothetical protein